MKTDEDYEGTPCPVAGCSGFLTEADDNSSASFVCEHTSAKSKEARPARNHSFPKSDLDPFRNLKMIEGSYLESLGNYESVERFVGKYGVLRTRIHLPWRLACLHEMAEDGETHPIRP